MDIFSEALKQGLTPAIVVGIYLIINKIIDNRKENEQLKLTSNIVDSFTKLNKFLDYMTKNIIDKEYDKCKYAIKTSFKSLSDSILKFAINTIINNNIKSNKENILENIDNIINSQYYVIYGNLHLYNKSNIKITDYIKLEWKEQLKKDIVNVIFNDSFTKEQKLYILTNKIEAKVTDYSIYITNKYSEHE